MSLATTSPAAMPLETVGRRARVTTLKVPVIVAALVVATTFWCSPNFIVQNGPDAAPFAGDFLQEWLGGYIVRAGDHSRFYDVDYAIALQHDPQLVGFQWKQSEYLPIVYPPFYYVLTVPLSYLPVHLAARIWVALMTAAFAASVWLLVRASSVRTSCLAGWLPVAGQELAANSVWFAVAPWLVTLAVFFAPLIENLVSSQKGTVCLLLLTSTFLLLDAKRPFTAGVVFGLLAFKPQFTLVIAVAMLAKRQWRFVGGGAVTGLLLIGVSLSLGWDVGRQYFEFATGMASYIYNQGYDLTKSHCLYGFFALALGLEQIVLVKVLTVVAAIAVLAMVAKSLSGELKFGEPRFAVQFAAMIVATLLLSPHLFSYDLTMLLLPMFLLAVPQVRTTMTASDRRTVLAAVMALFATAGFSQDVARQTNWQLTTIAMTWLLVLLTKTLQRDATPETRKAQLFASAR